MQALPLQAAPHKCPRRGFDTRTMLLSIVRLILALTPARPLRTRASPPRTCRPRRRTGPSGCPDPARERPWQWRRLCLVSNSLLRHGGSSWGRQGAHCRSGYGCASWPRPDGGSCSHRTRRPGWSARVSDSRSAMASPRDVLLHDHPPQRVAERVVLVVDLERGGRLGRARELRPSASASCPSANPPRRGGLRCSPRGCGAPPCADRSAQRPRALPRCRRPPWVHRPALPATASRDQGARSSSSAQVCSGGPNPSLISPPAANQNFAEFISRLEPDDYGQSHCLHRAGYKTTTLQLHRLPTLQRGNCRVSCTGRQRNAAAALGRGS